MELVIATKNLKKLKEIKHILKPLKLEITSLRDYPRAPRIVENGRTFQENARKKALKIARFTGKLTLGEDSGLEVFALNKAPGIYSSRFGGYPKSDERNNRKLLKLLGSIPLRKRRARYFCAVALADKHGIIATKIGTCSGLIGFQPEGNAGFGYDPLFIIPGYKRTFAQLGEKIKHKMSHRFRALSKANVVLQKYLEASRER